MKKLLLLGMLVFAVSGCGHISGGVAPSNIPLTPNSYSELGPVHGESCLYYFLGLIPVTKGNETKDALDDALKQRAETSALINITADTFAQNFLLLSRMCTQVNGIAVKLK